MISPLRSPGFPVEMSGADHLHAVSFKGNRTRGPGKCCEVGNLGYASVEMTKGRAVLPGRVAEQGQRAAACATKHNSKYEVDR